MTRDLEHAERPDAPATPVVADAALNDAGNRYAEANNHLVRLKMIAVLAEIERLPIPGLDDRCAQHQRELEAARDDLALLTAAATTTH